MKKEGESDSGGRLDESGDSCDCHAGACHSWHPVGGGRDAAKCPTRYRMVPTAKMNGVHNVKSTKVEKPAVR